MERTRSRSRSRTSRASRAATIGSPPKASENETQECYDSPLRETQQDAPTSQEVARKPIGPPHRPDSATPEFGAGGAILSNPERYVLIWAWRAKKLPSIFPNALVPQRHEVPK